MDSYHRFKTQYVHRFTADPLSYALAQAHMAQMDDPPAQVHMDAVFSHLLSCLPPPLVPVPAASDSQDPDDRFSLTSDDSQESDADDPAHLDFAAAASDGEDRISALPDVLLTSIVSRLPSKDAARTTVLSSRWRGVWSSTPLLLDDAHFLPAEDRQKRSVVRAIARAVAAHPGPIRCLRITHVPFGEHERELRMLFKALVSKNLEELVIVNRPWPLNLPLPAEVLRCKSLRRLHVGVWVFPEAARLTPAFADLRELGLYHVIANSCDVDAVFSRCRSLESLAIVDGYSEPESVQLRCCHRLRCVTLWMTLLRELDIAHCPCLERLVLAPIPELTRIKIGHAPKLEALGYFDAKFHVLIVRDTVIKAGTTVVPTAIVPSVKKLALNLRFGVREEVELLPNLLRCFPCIETLYIKSAAAESAQGVELDLREQLRGVDCVESCLKRLVFQGFHGDRSELDFVKFIIAKAQVLETMCVIMDDDFGQERFETMIMPLANGDWASKKVQMFAGWHRKAHLAWDIHSASDMSKGDPFDSWIINRD